MLFSVAVSVTYSAFPYNMTVQIPLSFVFEGLL